MPGAWRSILSYRGIESRAVAVGSQTSEWFEDRGAFKTQAGTFQAGIVPDSRVACGNRRLGDSRLGIRRLPPWPKWGENATLPLALGRKPCLVPLPRISCGGRSSVVGPRNRRGCGGIGRRAGFRFLWPQGRGGSTPLTRTSFSRPHHRNLVTLRDLFRSARVCRLWQVCCPEVLHWTI
jgi:hypothetical protein